MADKWPLANGNWSNAANWNGGTKPTTGDDVYADGKTVTIDENVDIGTGTLRTSQRSGGTSGGGFTLNTGITLTANVIASNSTCITASYATGTSSIIGNVSGPGPTQFISGVLFSGGGTLNITGNITCGVSNEQVGVRSTGTGQLNIIGNVTSAGTQSGADAIRITSTGAVTITGTVSNSSTANAINISGNCTLTINGNVSAIGSGATIGGSASPRLNLNGNAISSGSVAAISHNGMTLIHNGNITSSTNGRFVISVAFYLINSTSLMQHSYRVDNGGVAGVERSLYTGGQNLGQPTAANVRQGTVFGVSNEFTGTLAVPPAGSVALGVPVDNTTGTASITAADIRAAVGLASANLDTQLSASSIRAAVGLASANLDTQLADISADIGNINVDFTPILNRLPASLQDGLMRSYVVSMATDSLSAAALSSGAVSEIAGAFTGSGARLVSITVLMDAVAQQSAKVRLTKGAESYLATTDANGLATFNVDDGSWTVSITLSGATFAGATLVVDGNETVSYSLTANSAIAASDPDKVTGYWLCLSHLGVPESGVTVTLTAMSLPANSTGLVLDSASRSVTSGVDGVVSFTNLIPGVRYKVVRNSGKAFYFVCPEYQADPVDLASFIGT